MAAANNTNQDKKQCPCPYCVAKNHYPENCTHLPFHDSSQHPKPPNLRLSGAPVCGDFNNGQEMHVLSNTFACHARAPIPESCIQTEQTEDQPTGTSDTGSVSRRSLTIKCDQVYHRSLLSSKHTLQPTRALLLSVQHFHTCTPITEAHHQMHSQHTKISTHACTSSTDAHQQIHSRYTEANAQACTPSIETHQMYTEASTKAQMHSLYTDTTQVSHAHMANFPQQLSHLIIADQLDKNLASQSDPTLSKQNSLFILIGHLCIK